MTMALFLSSLIVGCIPHPSQAVHTWQSNNNTVELPVLRSNKNGERLFVSVDLPTVGKQYFMVDTGSSVSAIRADLVDEMQLHSSRKNGYLTGVSGRVPWIETVVPEIKLGPIKLSNTAFAVSVEGLPTQAGIVPIAGIIGNNIWDQFVMDIDYGLERIQLHKEYAFSDTAQKVQYDGQHILAAMELAFGDNGIQTILANVDTGSSGLILNSIHAPQLLEHGVKSRETIMGVGADKNNMQDYVVETVNVGINSLTLGGLTQPYTEQAILVTPPDDGFISLVGYHALENKRLIIDFEDERIQIEPSPSDLPVRNLHKDYLQSIQWGTMEASPMTEIQLHFILGEDTAAVRKLKRLINKDGNSEYRVALANHYYNVGNIEGALEELEKIDEEILLELGLMEAFILTYVHADQMKKAHILLAKELRRTTVVSHTYWLASLLDLMNNDIAGSKDWLYKAERHGSEDYYVHKALLKHRGGDITGAIATLRMDVQKHPLGNHSLWFLAQLAKDTEYAALAKSTIDAFLPLMHSRRSSLDFLSAAYYELGETELAVSISQIGKTRDCDTLETEDRQNCYAWYDALVHNNLTDNISTMEQIVHDNPGRADFADTLAVLYRANGEVANSVEMSRQAMIFSGSDPYMIWQALREPF